MILLLAHAALASDCAVATHVPELDAKFRAAETAYAELRVDVFAGSLDEAALILPCLGEVIPPAVAAHYHRLVGLRAFTERDEARAALAFAAARTLDPGYRFPESLVPAGHALHTTWSATDLATGRREAVPAPRAGSLVFDGTAGLERPAAWPTILQFRDASEAVRATRYLAPGDALPPYDAVAPLPSAVATAPAKAGNPGIPLAIGAGAAAVVSGTLYGLAAASAAEFETYEGADSREELDALRGRTNGLVVGSIGAGVLAVAGGVGAVVVGRW